MTTQPKVSKTRAIDLLTTSVAAISELKNQSTDSSEFIKWRRDTEVFISHIFSDSDRHLNDFQDISYYPFMTTLGGDNSAAYRSSFLSGLNKAESILESMINEIKTLWDITEHEASPSELASSTKAMSVTNSVFPKNQFTLDEHLVFMLSPFGEPFDEIFENHIKPTIEATHNLNCVRADTSIRQPAVIQRHLRLHQRSKTIYPPIDRKNPMCSTEIGLGHSNRQGSHSDNSVEK